MSASRSPIFLSSATGLILPRVTATCRSSACCTRTFTRKPANKFARNNGTQTHQSARLVHDDRGRMDDFLQPQTVSLAHGRLGCRTAIHAGPADFENSVGRLAF